MSDELKPAACPFCGHDNVDVFYEGSSDWYVMCGMCIADGPSGGSKIRAIAAWNTRRPTPEQSRETRERAESDALTLVGHAEYLRGMGQSDMPSWFLGLAERIARGAGLMTLADRCAAMDRSALGREGSDADQA
tara:strand:+ start:2326 stop:2727 length:402 start_codon:yes stop_codon:yes gene_type:complete